MMTRVVLSAVSVVLTLSALASGNYAAHPTQIRRATKRSMTSMSKKASKTKKGKSSKLGSSVSNGNDGGATASPNNCVTPSESCLPGSCVGDFYALLDNTVSGYNTVLCNDAPITVMDTMTLIPTSNVKISCCDQCDFGCKLQLGANKDMFSQINPTHYGESSFVLDGVDLFGNGFHGAAIETRHFTVNISNSIVSGFILARAAISVESETLTVMDTKFVNNGAEGGAVDLTNSSGSFVRTKLLNNTPIVMGYGAVVTVTPNGELVKVEFEDSTFANDVANLEFDVFLYGSGTATVDCDPATNDNSDGVRVAHERGVSLTTTCRP